MIDEFIICAYFGHFSPVASGDAYAANSDQDENYLKKVKACGFNTITTKDLKKVEDDIEYAPDFNTNVYLLQRLRKLGGLHAIIWDNDMFWGSYSSEALAAAIANYNGNLSGDLRNLIYAYQVGDEPVSSDGRADLALSDFLSNVLNPVTNGDSKITAFANLAGFWATTGWMDAITGYYAYLDNYFDNYDQYSGSSKTFLVSFDYYAFDVNTAETINGFWAMAMPATGPVSYFRHLSAFASRTREKRLNGFDLRFVGVCCSTQHDSGDTQHPFPTPHKMRYEAYSQLCYGAKGIIWFTYQRPFVDGYYYNSPEGNHEIFSTLAVVNDEIKWIGNALLSLEWLETIHGADPDPESSEVAWVYGSEEASFLTISNSDYIAQLINNGSDSIPSTLMIANFQHPVTQQNHLLLFNKSGAGQYWQRWGSRIYDNREGTSVDSKSIVSPGSQTFTTDAGLHYAASGSHIRATSQGYPGSFMEGVATYSGTTLIINVDYYSVDAHPPVSGLYFDWFFTHPPEEFRLDYSGGEPGNLVSLFSHGEQINFSLLLNGNQIVRIKTKHSPEWKKLFGSYDSSSDITTLQISLETCEGMLISLAARPTS